MKRDSAESSTAATEQTAESSVGSVTPESTPPVADMATLAGALIAEQPAVQEHAIAQAQSEAEANKDKDSAGEPFNAAVHATNADGSPRKNANGTYAKKRGRKSGSAAPNTTGPAKIVIPGGAGVTQTQLNQEQLARKGGAGAANLVMALCIGLCGEEWHPRQDAKLGLDEKAMLEAGFGDYFVATNRADLPPGWALVACMAMYALPRFGMPKTQTRLQKVKNWCGAKIVQFKARRAGLKVKVNTESEAKIVEEELYDRQKHTVFSGANAR